MALRVNTAEGQTNGTIFNRTNSGGGGSGDQFDIVTLTGCTAVFSNAASAHGTMSYRFDAAPATSTAIISWDGFNDQSIMQSIYFRITGAPTTANTDIMQFRNAAGIAATLRLTTARTLVATRTSSGTTVTGTESGTLTTDVWYRVEMIVTGGTSATTGRIRYQLWRDDFSTPPPSFECDVQTIDVGSANLTTARFGKLTAAAVMPLWYVDTARVNNVATYPGPYEIVAPPVGGTPGTVQVNTAEGGTNGVAVTTGTQPAGSGSNFDLVSVTTDGIISYSSTQKALGALSYRFSGTAVGDVGFMLNQGFSDSAGGAAIDLFLTGYPTAQACELIQLRGTDRNATLLLSTTGMLFIQTGATTVSGSTATTAVPLNTWVRVELQCTASATVGQVKGWCGLRAATGTGSVWNFTSAATLNTGANPIVSYRFGKFTAASAMPIFYLDNIRTASGATGLQGPYVASGSAPTASAGPARIDIEPWTRQNLAGSDNDAEGGPMVRTWRQISGPSVGTIQYPNSQVAYYTAPGTLTGGVAVFGYRVVDADGLASAESTVSHTILGCTERIVVGGIEKPLRVEVVTSVIPEDPDDPAPPPPSALQLLDGKIATSDVADSTSESGNPITNLTDGSVGTRWISEPIGPVRLTYDLENYYTIQSVTQVIAADTVKNWQIQVSPDGTAWTTIAAGVTNNTLSQTINTTTFTGTAAGRYLRFVGVDRWNDAFGNSWFELDATGVLTTPPGGTPTPPAGGSINLVGKPVTTNVAESTTEPGNPASRIVDGDALTRWISAPQDNVNGTYAEIDTQGVYTFSQIDVVFASDTFKTYQLQVSQNGSTYTTVASGVTNGTTKQTISHTNFNATPKGRYIRILGVDRWNVAFGYSIYEVTASGTLNASVPVGTITALNNGTITNTSVPLSWTYTGSAVTNYIVKRNNVQIATPTGLSYTDSGLTAGTTYGYSVQAVLAGGGFSNIVTKSVTTTGGTVGTGWLSGTGDDSADNNAGGGFAAWRGQPVTYARMWGDATQGAMSGLDMIGPYQTRGWNGTLDIACGGPSRDGLPSWGAAATGGMDAFWRQQCRTILARWGNLKAVHLSMSHELNGNWYPWSVNSGNVAAFKTAWARWYNIVQEELVAKGKIAKVCLSLNSDNVNGVPIPSMVPALNTFDILGCDFYSMYPDLNTQADWDANLNATKDGGASPRGIGAWFNYAASIGKPLSFPEWGPNAHTRTENPSYIGRMNAYFRSKQPVNPDNPGAGKLAGEAYFNTWDSCRMWPNTSIPQTAAAYNAQVWGFDGAGGGTPNPPAALNHGQDVTTTNTGRAGAAAASVANYSATLVTAGATTYNTTTTVRNTRFTGKVIVTGGNVTFEFCQFAYAPSTGSAALQIYDAGNDGGNLVANWCDIDSGLRNAQGTFESSGFQAGERGSSNPVTTLGSFNLYRCRIEGFGNGVGIHKWQAAPSALTECYVANNTTGGGSHPDGVEIYSSDNVTLLRNRLICNTNTDQSCINITTDFGNVPSPGDPLLIQDNYINGGISPILTRWFNQGGGTYIRNVKYKGNRLGDSSRYGRMCDFNSMNVTYDEAYAIANPTVLYWASDNVWAPNGEGVTNAATSPDGSQVAGRPHTPGSFVSAANFYGGEVFTWNGQVVGPTAPAGPPSTPAAPTGVAGNTTVTLNWTAPASNGAAITAYDVQNVNTGTVTPLGNVTSTTLSGLTNGTAYTFKVRATNSAGSSIYSAASAAITPAAPVSPPPSGTVTHGVDITAANTGPWQIQGVAKGSESVTALAGPSRGYWRFDTPDDFLPTTAWPSNANDANPSVLNAASLKGGVVTGSPVTIDGYSVPVGTRIVQYRSFPDGYDFYAQGTSLKVMFRGCRFRWTNGVSGSGIFNDNGAPAAQQIMMHYCDIGLLSLDPPNGSEALMHIKNIGGSGHRYLRNHYTNSATFLQPNVDGCKMVENYITGFIYAYGEKGPSGNGPDSTTYHLNGISSEGGLSNTLYLRNKILCASPDGATGSTGTAAGQIGYGTQPGQVGYGSGSEPGRLTTQTDCIAVFAITSSNNGVTIDSNYLGGSGVVIYAGNADGNAQNIVVQNNQITSRWWTNGGNFGVVTDQPNWGTNGNSKANNTWADDYGTGGNGNTAPANRQYPTGNGPRKGTLAI